PRIDDPTGLVAVERPFPIHRHTERTERLADPPRQRVEQRHRQVDQLLVVLAAVDRECPADLSTDCPAGRNETLDPHVLENDLVLAGVSETLQRLLLRHRAPSGSSRADSKRETYCRHRTGARQRWESRKLPARHHPTDRAAPSRPTTAD